MLLWTLRFGSCQSPPCWCCVCCSCWLAGCPDRTEGNTSPYRDPWHSPPLPSYPVSRCINYHFSSNISYHKCLTSKLNYFSVLGNIEKISPLDYDRNEVCCTRYIRYIYKVFHKNNESPVLRVLITRNNPKIWMKCEFFSWLLSQHKEGKSRRKFFSIVRDLSFDPDQQRLSQ